MKDRERVPSRIRRARAKMMHRQNAQVRARVRRETRSIANLQARKPVINKNKPFRIRPQDPLNQKIEEREELEANHNTNPVNEEAKKEAKNGIHPGPENKPLTERLTKRDQEEIEKLIQKREKEAIKKETKAIRQGAERKIAEAVEKANKEKEKNRELEQELQEARRQLAIYKKRANLYRQQITNNKTKAEEVKKELEVIQRKRRKANVAVNCIRLSIKKVIPDVAPPIEAKPEPKMPDTTEESKAIIPSINGLHTTDPQKEVPSKEQESIIDPVKSDDPEPLEPEPNLMEETEGVKVLPIAENEEDDSQFEELRFSMIDHFIRLGYDLPFILECEKTCGANIEAITNYIYSKRQH